MENKLMKYVKNIKYALLGIGFLKFPIKADNINCWTIREVISKT